MSNTKSSHRVGHTLIGIGFRPQQWLSVYQAPTIVGSQLSFQMSSDQYKDHIFLRIQHYRTLFVRTAPLIGKAPSLSELIENALPQTGSKPQSRHPNHSLDLPARSSRPNLHLARSSSPVEPVLHLRPRLRLRRAPLHIPPRSRNILHRASATKVGR